MSTGTGISALYREFTDALTEVLVEAQVTRLVVAVSHGHALPSKGILPTASMNIISGRDSIHTPGLSSVWNLLREKQTSRGHRRKSAPDPNRSFCVSHPRRDLVKSIGVCPASPPTP
jgi:hypothetical protein